MLAAGNAYPNSDWAYQSGNIATGTQVQIPNTEDT